eukprot:11018240-Karenia_brevis.AAC.1
MSLYDEDDEAAEPASLRHALASERLGPRSGVADELSGRVRKLDSVLERVAEACFAQHRKIPLIAKTWKST